MFVKNEILDTWLCIRDLMIAIIITFNVTGPIQSGWVNFLGPNVQPFCAGYKASWEIMSLPPQIYVRAAVNRLNLQANLIFLAHY